MRPRHACALVALLLVAFTVACASLATESHPAMSPQLNTSSENDAKAANAACLGCHAQAGTGRQVDGRTVSLLVSADDFADTPHAAIACVACHTEPLHAGKITTATGCTGCHHNLALHFALGNPHLAVECAACHFNADGVAIAPGTRQVVVARMNALGEPVARSNHTLVASVPCERCHVRGNSVGAAAMVLPPKDISCIGCHTASPAIASPLSFAAIGLFLAGIASSVSIWLGGSVAGKTGLSLAKKLALIARRAVAVVFSRRLWLVVKTGLVDGLFHRRLLQESGARWTAHSLILFPLVVRLGLGIATGLAVQFYPDAPLTRLLVDRNAPAVQFTNDFLALLVLVGVAYAAFLRASDRQRRALTQGQDTLALVLLSLLFAGGFVIEGAHFLLAQIPWSDASYAFGGAAAAALLRFIPLDWPAVYPMLFYIHASLVAALIAYLPFSKFFHLLVSPIFVAIRPALFEREHVRVLPSSSEFHRVPDAPGNSGEL